MKQLNLFYPQWQGSGPDRTVYYGALELKKTYLNEADLRKIEVSTADVKDTKNDIYGYDVIKRQMKMASDLIAKEHPDRIFTIGGGCDCGILPVSYLNKLLKNNMTVIWFDAHGDLNLPKLSLSKHFYGMPVRLLLGEGDRALLDLCHSTLNHEQLIMAGLRKLDKAEIDYLKREKISVLGVREIETHPEVVIEAVKTRRAENIYIHLDLDVLDPTEYPYSAVPEAGGLKIRTVTMLLEELSRLFNLTGLGLFEYKPGSPKPDKLLQSVMRIGLNLSRPC